MVTSTCDEVLPALDSFKNNAESFSSRSAHLGRDEHLNQCDSDVYSLMHISGLIVCGITSLHNDFPNWLTSQCLPKHSHMQLSVFTIKPTSNG